MSRQKVLESAAVEMKETTNCASLEIQHQVGETPTSNISPTMRLSQNQSFLKDEGLEAESKIEISFKPQVTDLCPSSRPIPFCRTKTIHRSKYNAKPNARETASWAK
jgi:hypothetical protein